MSASFLKRAGLVLLALLILWGILALLRRGTSEDIPGFVLPTFDPAALNQITITTETDTIHLVRVQGNTWEANGLPAASPPVNELYNAVFDSTTARRSELAARSAASHPRMGVEGMGRVHMFFMAGSDTLADLRVGNPTETGRGAFVRLGDAAEVYRVPTDLARLGSQGVDYWRDKQIVAVTPEQIGSVTVSWPGRRYALTRSDHGWAVDGAPTDSTAVATMIQGYANLEATGFPTADELDTISFSSPDGRIVLQGMSGDTLAALEFDSTAAGIWTRRASGGPVFKLAAWYGARLAPDKRVLAGR
jgi:hypothetical protein